MTNRQFVISKYPNAELDFKPAPTVTYGVLGGIKIKRMRSLGRDWYYIKTEFMGEKIGRGGSTPDKAWKQAAIEIKNNFQRT